MKLNLKLLTIAATMSFQYIPQSFGSVDIKNSLTAHEIGIRDDFKLKLLSMLGELFEVGVPFPERFLIESSKESSDTISDDSYSGILEYIAQKYKNYSGEENLGDSILDISKDLFAEMIQDMDQLEKQELFFVICGSLIPDDCIGEDTSVEECQLLLCNLFPAEHQYRVMGLLEYLEKESDLIQSIAEMESEANRISAINENFPKNRRKGAMEQIRQRIQWKNLSDDLKKLQINLERLLKPDN